MTTELLESEHGSTALTSESPAPHWIDDCPKSTLQWWFPLVLSATIYLINIFYILGRYLLAKMRPTPTPHSTAYPNIFRGIEHSAVEEDVDQSLEQVDEDIFQSSQSQWLNEGPWSDSEDFKFPSTSGYELSPKTSAKLDQSENEEEDNDNGDEVVQGKIVKRIDNRKNEPKRKANFITLQLENEEFSQNKTGAITAAPNVDRKRSGKRTRLFGSNKERLGFRIRVFCEEMTSVSYPTGRFMVNLGIKSHRKYDFFSKVAIANMLLSKNLKELCYKMQILFSNLNLRNNSNTLTLNIGKKIISTLININQNESKYSLVM